MLCGKVDGVGGRDALGEMRANGPFEKVAIEGGVVDALACMRAYLVVSKRKENYGAVLRGAAVEVFDACVNWVQENLPVADEALVVELPHATLLLVELFVKYALC